MFDESVQDEQIYSIIEHLYKDFPNKLEYHKQTKMYKWARLNPVQNNWVLEIVPIPRYRKTERDKKKILI